MSESPKDEQSLATRTVPYHTYPAVVSLYKIMTITFTTGDVVETADGVGVVVEDRRPEEDLCVVRLNRVPGQSIASASVASLPAKQVRDESYESKMPSDAGTFYESVCPCHPYLSLTLLCPFCVCSVLQILRVLPVAPGMTTTLVDNKAQKVLVHSYVSEKEVYLCSFVNENKNENESSASDNPDLQEFPLTALQASPSAKFWPLLETLMKRGDETANAARQFWDQQSATQAVVAKTGQALQSPPPVKLDLPTVEALPPTDAVVQAAQAQYDAAKPAIESQFQQILTMVKDEEITTLFQNAQERLEQLINSEPEKVLTQKAKEALQQQGIRIHLGGTKDDDDKNVNDEAEGAISVAQSLQQSRQAALESLQRILRQADLDTADLQAAREELAHNFGQAFDALATAARSDRSLATVWDAVTEKTAVWQESTGRLWQTRSASLFVQGATRLQARAAAMWRVHQRTTSAIGSQMTKAFTEGDAAIARIKSIQLGDALKDRLVRAIEVRSDSLGGLDAIIAGALSSAGGEAEHIQSMLSSLQANATTATTDARETLLSVLSRHSTYRDVALSKLEQVLCDLDNQFEIPPADIAALASGQGGTAKLFEPIARRAWQQIEKQLDEAESQVSDKNVIQGLERVRKIMSGELTLAALTDEIVSVLNDENVVAAGEVFVQKGEEVLDVLEGVSSNKVVTDALKIAEKAGITKDSVMREIEKLDVDQLLDTAGGAVTDETKRRILVSNAIDTALDFILRILPSMPVPPFEGVRDGLLYNISNLSMKGFKVKKEDIMIELAGMRALKRSHSSVSSTSKTSVSKAEKITQNGDLGVSDNIAPAVEAEDSMEIEEINQEVNATELLIIDVRRISAVLDDTEWSFEQTYMPYLKGEGKVDVRMSDGAIRLQFELRKRRKASKSEATGGEESKVEWEPVLCLHDRSCSIDEVELKMQGEGRITWLVNKAAIIFKNRKYSWTRSY